MPKNRRDRSGRPGRSNPPPEATGRERAFFGAAVTAGSTLTLVLKDGEQISGVVAGADRSVIQLQPEDGVTRVLPKADIRYVAE